MATQKLKPADQRALVLKAKGFLEKKAPVLQALALKNFKPDAAIATVLWDMNRNEKLAKSSLPSVLYCMKYAVERGLPIGGSLGYVHMVPYWDKNQNCYVATPIVGFEGKVQMMVDAKACHHVEAREVYEGDDFSLVYTQEGPTLKHVYGDKKGSVRGCYCIIHPVDRNAAPHIEFMTWDEIEKVKASSKAKFGPWVDHPIPMGCKTVLHKTSKYVPKLPELAQRLAEDDEQEFGAALEVDAEISTSQTEEIKGALAATVDTSTGEVVEKQDDNQHVDDKELDSILDG